MEGSIFQQKTVTRSSFGVEPSSFSPSGDPSEVMPIEDESVRNNSQGIEHEMIEPVAFEEKIKVRSTAKFVVIMATLCVCYCHSTLCLVEFRYLYQNQNSSLSS